VVNLTNYVNDNRLNPAFMMSFSTLNIDTFNVDNLESTDMRTLIELQGVRSTITNMLATNFKK